MTDTALADAQDQLAAMLAGHEPPEPVDPFALGDLPRCVDGVLVPSKTVIGNGRIEYVLLGKSDTITTARRSVLTYRAGRPVLLWVGDDRGQRDAALRNLLGQIAEHQARRGRR